MFHEALMEKQAKSRLIKEVEALFRTGKSDDKIKAMRMLRRAEAIEGTGSLAAREIKGLKRRNYGSGQMGTVQDVFYGGEMTPAKGLKFNRKFYAAPATDIAEELENEYRTTRRVNELIRDNPEIARRIDAVKAKGMVGKSYNLSAEERSRLKELQAAATSRRGISKKDKNELQELVRRQSGKKAGQGRRMVMSRLPEAPTLSRREIDARGGPEAMGNRRAEAIRDAYEGMVALQKKDPNLSFSDNKPMEGHNVAFGPSGKAILYDFGLANPKGNPALKHTFGKANMGRLIENSRRLAEEGLTDLSNPDAMQWLRRNQTRKVRKSYEAQRQAAPPPVPPAPPKASPKGPPPVPPAPPKNRTVARIDALREDFDRSAAEANKRRAEGLKNLAEELRAERTRKRAQPRPQAQPRPRPQAQPRPARDTAKEVQERVQEILQDVRDRRPVPQEIPQMAPLPQYTPTPPVSRRSGTTRRRVSNAPTIREEGSSDSAQAALLLGGLGLGGGAAYLATRDKQKNKGRSRQEKAASWQFRLIDEHNKSKFVRAMLDNS